MKKLITILVMVGIMFVIGIGNANTEEGEPMKSLTDEQLENREDFKKNQQKYNTSIWYIDRYVDNFGDRNGSYFIRNSLSIKGVFDNTATTNSRLLVVFLIDGSYKMALQLYEYAGNNPVKSYSIPDIYNVYVKDKNGKKFYLTAINHNDRLQFTKYDSLDLHRLFIKGDIVKFYIKEQNSSTTNYKFNVNPKGYSNAYKKLREKRKK